MSDLGNFYVVCHNHYEFQEYITEKRRSVPLSVGLPQYVFVTSPNMLRGLSAERLQGCYYGNWKSRPDIEEIKTIIAVTKGHWNTAGIV